LADGIHATAAYQWLSQFAFLGFQLLGVETFGEAEFWLALLKLGGLVAYFLFSIM
jgi:yeast amino acid transporter